jgi:hypothetical protein
MAIRCVDFHNDNDFREALQALCPHPCPRPTGSDELEKYFKEKMNFVRDAAYTYQFSYGSRKEYEQANMIDEYDLLHAYIGSGKPNVFLQAKITPGPYGWQCGVTGTVWIDIFIAGMRSRFTIDKINTSIKTIYMTVEASGYNTIPSEEHCAVCHRIDVSREVWDKVQAMDAGDAGEFSRERGFYDSMWNLPCGHAVCCSIHAMGHVIDCEYYGVMGMSTVEEKIDHILTTAVILDRMRAKACASTSMVSLSPGQNVTGVAIPGAGAMVKSSKRSCLHCGRRGDIKQCSRCHKASLCSKECATAAWPTHKKDCKKWKKENEREATKSV